MTPQFSGLLLNLGWIFLSLAYFFIVYMTHSSSKVEPTVKVEFLASDSHWQGKEVKCTQMRWKSCLIRKKRFSRKGGGLPRFNPFDLLYFLDFCSSSKDPQFVHSVWVWKQNILNHLSLEMAAVEQAGHALGLVARSPEQHSPTPPPQAHTHNNKKSWRDSGWIPRRWLIMWAFILFKTKFSWCHTTELSACRVINPAGSHVTCYMHTAVNDRLPEEAVSFKNWKDYTTVDMEEITRWYYIIKGVNTILIIYPKKSLQNCQCELWVWKSQQRFTLSKYDAESDPQSGAIWRDVILPDLNCFDLVPGSTLALW